MPGCTFAVVVMIAIMPALFQSHNGTQYAVKIQSIVKQHVADVEQKVSIPGGSSTHGRAY